MSDQDWIEKLSSQYGAKQAAALRGDETTFKAASFWLQETAEHHWHEIIAALREKPAYIDALITMRKALVLNGTRLTDDAINAYEELKLSVANDPAAAGAPDPGRPGTPHRSGGGLARYRMSERCSVCAGLRKLCPMCQSLARS